jgi:hypothetical protein
MENTEILAMWQSYSNKLEQSLQISRGNAMAILSMKVDNLLSSMRPVKIFTVAIGIVWVLFIDSIIIGTFKVANTFFLFSAIGQVLLTKLAIGIYIYQLVLIQQADNSAPVITLQQRLARLQSTTLWLPRLLFLQLPLWTMFYWNKSMLLNGNWLLFTVQAIVTLLFAAAGIWLFLNINERNSQKRWFRWLFSGREWAPIMQSIELLHQIEEYKKEESPAPSARNKD